MSCFNSSCFDSIESNPFINLNGEYLVRFFRIENPYAGDPVLSKAFIAGVEAQAKAAKRVADNEAFEAGRAALKAVAKQRKFTNFTKFDVVSEVSRQDPYEGKDERLSQAWMSGLASFERGVIMDGAVSAFGEDYYRAFHDAIESALECATLMREAYEQRLKWRR